MATKQEWEDYVKAVQQYLKDLKKWVKKLPQTGEVNTANTGIETPPKPPPNP